MLAFALFTLGLGGLALGFGLRGRIEPGAFECRRCRYPATEAAAARCPECGADLATAGASRPTRRRRIGAIRTGAVLIAIGAGCLAYHVATRSTRFNLYASLPSSVLGWMALSAEAETMDRAATELVARHAKGELDAATLVWVKDGLLARLDDPKAAWTLSTGSLVQAAMADGLVSDADWVRFVDRHLAFTPAARERNRAGRTWTLELGHRGPALATGDAQFASVRIRVHGPTVRWGEDLLSDPEFRSWSGMTVGGSGSTSLAAPPAPGRGVAAFSFRVDVLDPLRTDSFDDDAVLGSFERSGSIELEFVADGTPILETDPDPAKAEAIRQALRITSVSLGPRNSESDPYLEIFLRMTSGPSCPDVAFEMFLRPEGGGREWPLGSLAVAAKVGTNTNARRSCPGLVPGRHELVFRPSIEVAERAGPKLVRPWTGGEIVIPVEVPGIR